MTAVEKIAELEAVLAQFLRPIKNVPFSLIVKSIAGYTIIPIDDKNASDAALVNSLRLVAIRTAELVKLKPIRRNRPNEVGNDIEAYVIEAASKLGLKASRPQTASGKKKSTGYPDIHILDAAGRPTYLECKIFGEGNELTTMRSFYLSPSDDFKVTSDARHLLIAFGVERIPINGSRDSEYFATSFKLVDLSGLKCDVKYEFNSDNRRLYDANCVISEGKL